MPNQAAKPNHAVAMSESVDPAVVATIVRTVLDRLKAQYPESNTATKSNTTDGTVTSSDRVISVATIENIPARSATKFLVGSGAVVTPAARDEARRRGITIQRVANLPAISSDTISGSIAAIQHSSTSCGLIDAEDRGRGAVVLHQLQRRGVVIDPAVTVILSDTPAAEVQRQCQRGRRAVMIRRIDDVDRFQAELGPEAWVLDMIDMNVITAANVAARIAKRGGIRQ